MKQTPPRLDFHQFCHRPCRPDKVLSPSDAFRRCFVIPCAQFHYTPARFHNSCSFRRKTLLNIDEHVIQWTGINFSTFLFLFLYFTYYFRPLFNHFVKASPLFRCECRLLHHILYDLLAQQTRRPPRWYDNVFLCMIVPFSGAFFLFQDPFMEKQFVALTNIVQTQIASIVPLSRSFLHPGPIGNWNHIYMQASWDFVKGHGKKEVQWATPTIPAEEEGSSSRSGSQSEDDGVESP